MSEKTPEPNESPEFWESKLKEAGFGEIPLQEKIPDQKEEPAPSQNFEKEAIKVALEGEFARFSALDSGSQDAIIEDLREKANQGMSYKDITLRLKQLLKGTEEFESMGQESSDKYYSPKRSFEEIKLGEESKKIDEIIAEGVDDLLKKLEEMKQEGIRNANESIKIPENPEDLKDFPPASDLIQ